MEGATPIGPRVTHPYVTICSASYKINVDEKPIPCHTHAMTKQPANIVGQRFGRVVVTSMLKISKTMGAIWNIQCDCGGTHKASTSNLRAGTVTSCGYKCKLKPKRPQRHVLSLDKAKKKRKDAITKADTDDIPKLSKPITLPKMPWDQPRPTPTEDNRL